MFNGIVYLVKSGISGIVSSVEGFWVFTELPFRLNTWYSVLPGIFAAAFGLICALLMFRIAAKLL